MFRIQLPIRIWNLSLIPVVLLYGFTANTLKSADKTVNKLLMDNQSDAGG